MPAARRSSPERPGGDNAACGFRCPAGAPPRMMSIARSRRWKRPSLERRERLSRFEGAELFRGHTAILEGGGELANRLVDSLRGQLKSAEVHGDALAGAEVEMRLHRFGRIHVDV